MEGYFLTTQFWKVVMTDDQMYLGRLVIKTITPRLSLPEITEEEQKDFFILIKKLESFFKDEIGATMFNYSCLMNNAYRDGETPHVHFHFRPRYQNPVTILGHTFSDPNFGEHYISPTLTKDEPVTAPKEVREYVMTKLQEYCK
jgi:diadenosine tetraphosphate (Ap4A) HIT family hydrolase